MRASLLPRALPLSVAGTPRVAAPALFRRELSFHAHFTGTVGRIRSGPDGLDLAIASARLLNGTESDRHWVACIARDQLLRAQIVRQLSVGSIVRIAGEIEPRRREIKGVAFYDVVFVAKCFETLEPPAPSSGAPEPSP